MINEKEQHYAIEKQLDDQLERLNAEKETMLKEYNNLRDTNDELIEGIRLKN